jgi:hypothetical protein
VNDNNNIVGQNTNSVPAQGLNQPQAAIQDTKVSTNGVASPPVGSANKEVGPIAAPVSEFAKSSEAELQVDRDLRELGVEAEKEKPELTNEHKLAGIEYSGVYAPTPTASTSPVKLPMTEKEIQNKLRGQDDDSGKWFAWLLRKIITVMSIKT